MTEETITLMSLADLEEATLIKTRLETKGITCFMNNKQKPLPLKPVEKRHYDIKVFMKDLDKALQVIEEE
jgi:hypothetical protein